MCLLAHDYAVDSDHWRALYRYKLPVPCSRAKTIPGAWIKALLAPVQPKSLLLIMVLLSRIPR